MSFVLKPVDSPVWQTLHELAGGTWIWLDMVEGGLHLAEWLPAAIPAQLSHVWGWGPKWWVRGRADLDLPGGIGALILREALPGTGQIVDVQALPFRTWATSDNAVSLAPSADRLPKQMRQLIVRLQTPTDSGLWQTTASFVDALASVESGG